MIDVRGLGGTEIVLEESIYSCARVVLPKRSICRMGVADSKLRFTPRIVGGLNMFPTQATVGVCGKAKLPDVVGVVGLCP